MGRSCEAHDRSMEKCFFRNFSKFFRIFAAEISTAEDLAFLECVSKLRKKKVAAHNDTSLLSNGTECNN